MCRRCGKLMGLESTCPWCGTANAARRRPVRDEAGGHGATVTTALTGAVLIIYAAAIIVGGVAEGRGLMDLLGPDPSFIRKIGLMNNAAVMDGEWWRLVAAVFLHLSLLHVLFNAMALWVVGRPFEDDIGPATFWAIFFVSGVAGFALGLVFDTADTGGASGAISGLIGAIIARRRLVDGSFDHPLTRLAIRFAIFTAFFGLAVPGINNVAHGGGFAAGALLGALRSAGAGLPLAKLLWRVVAVLGVLATLGTGAAIALSGARASGEDVMRMDACIRKVSETLARLEPGSPEALTERLDPCISDHTAFAGEPDALEALDKIEDAAKAVHRALGEGLPAPIARATEDFGRARRAWESWVRQNLGRLGLRLGP
jgi:rhomboid protease GluP